MSGPEENEAGTMTSAMLAALAHPLRRRMLRMLSHRKSARGADFVEELGVPSNSISFHIRTLARAGFLAEAPELARDRRDKVWVLVPGTYNVGVPTAPVADAELGSAVLHALASEHQELLARSLSWLEEYASGRTTDLNGAFARHRILLTEDQFERAMKGIEDAIRGADEASHETQAGLLAWEIDIIAASERV